MKPNQRKKQDQVMSKNPKSRTNRFMDTPNKNQPKTKSWLCQDLAWLLTWFSFFLKFNARIRNVWSNQSIVYELCSSILWTWQYKGVKRCMNNEKPQKNWTPPLCFHYHCVVFMLFFSEFIHFCHFHTLVLNLELFLRYSPWSVKKVINSPSF